MKEQRFIIWGVGVRGRRLCRFLGKDKVIGYIDKRPDLQGNIVDGIPVKSLDDCINSGLDEDAWLVITPGLVENSMRKILEDIGIFKYFYLSECPDEFYDYDFHELKEKFIAQILKKQLCLLEQFNLYSLLLYEEARKQGFPVKILIKEDELLSERVVHARKNGIEFIHEKDVNAKMFYCGNAINNRRLPPVNFMNLTCKNMCLSLEQFRGVHKGKRCFIVATGPSLRMSDLEKLREHSEICISMNGIYLSFDKVKWRPNYFVMTDPMLIYYRNVIKNMDVKYKFISDNDKDFWDDEELQGVHKLHVRFLEKNINFSTDLVKGVYSAYNVTYVCLQIAVFMGFNKVYLLGVDFSSLLNKSGRDSHFIKNYNRDEKLINGKTIGEIVYSENNFDELIKDIQYRGYVCAREYCDKHGIEIYNATRGGYLDVFERVDFDELMEEKNEENKQNY